MAAIKNYPRLLQLDGNQSVFLFGPRGTGKSSWVQSNLPQAIYIDLLNADVYTDLLAHPHNLGHYLTDPNKKVPIIIDEVQKIPPLLDEVHRLIENQKRIFVLTGSSARKLRRTGVNLLAGRAETVEMYPLTAEELGEDFDLGKALEFGMLPSIYSRPNPARYLKSYVQTYLREEVFQEGLTRNLPAFSRFLEATSFSQGSVLNLSSVAEDCGTPRKTVEGYFYLLEDLLLGVRIQSFTRRAKRKIVSHPKFYFFDAGVYRTLRPRGPLDTPDEIHGIALETLVFQELRALNSYLELGYELFFWRTDAQLEVDFVLYGERGLLAFEVKKSSRVKKEDLKGLQTFLADYPMAKAYLLYGGERRLVIDGVHVIPLFEFFKGARQLL